jgi:hypothetical protein
LCNTLIEKIPIVHGWKPYFSTLTYMQYYH